MKKYLHHNIGSLAQIGQYTTILPDSKLEIEGKLFINDLVGLTGSEISFNSVAPQMFMKFSHKHKTHEEVYIILSGQGEFVADDERIMVSEGSVIRMDKEVERTWRNSSKSEDLVFIVIQTLPNSIDNSKPTDDGILVNGDYWGEA